MNYIEYCKKTGKILQFGVTNLTIYELKNLNIDRNYIEAPADLNIKCNFVDLNSLCIFKLPIAPTKFHEYDYEKGIWFLSEDGLKRAWSEVRERRNKILSDTDWVMLSDVEISEEMREKWTVYRNSLRNITSQSDPFLIEWPIPPG